MKAKREINYRSIRQYKYQLLKAYRHPTGIKVAWKVNLPFLSLKQNGLLTVKKGYSWDGPSGTTIDTKTFMRGSLVHDALYQLIRMELLNPDRRETADRLLKEICLEDGMNRFRAWYVYKSVRAFGGRHVRKGRKK